MALRIGDWDAVLAMLRQTTLEGDKTMNLRALTDELTAYATGMKALESDDVAAAEAASERMDAGLWRAAATPERRERGQSQSQRRGQKQARRKEG